MPDELEQRQKLDQVSPSCDEQLPRGIYVGNLGAYGRCDVLCDEQRNSELETKCISIDSVLFSDSQVRPSSPGANFSRRKSSEWRGIRIHEALP